MRLVAKIYQGNDCFRLFLDEATGHLTLTDSAGTATSQVKRFDRVTLFDPQLNGGTEPFPFLCFDTIPFSEQSIQPTITVPPNSHEAKLRLPIRTAIWNLDSYALLELSIAVDGALVQDVEFKNLRLTYAGQTPSFNHSKGLLEQLPNAVLEFKGDGTLGLAEKCNVHYLRPLGGWRDRELRFSFEAAGPQPNLFRPVLSQIFLYVREPQRWTPFGIAIEKDDFQQATKLTRVRQRLLCTDESGALQIGPTGTWAVDWEIPPRAFWRHWNERIVDLYRRGLVTAQDASSASFLPRLEDTIPPTDENEQTDWNGARLRLRIRDGVPFATKLYSDIFDYVDTEDFAKPNAKLQLRICDSFLCPPAQHATALKFTIDEIQDHDGHPLKVLWKPTTTTPQELATQPVVRVDLGEGAEVKPSQIVRMGALDLIFNGQVASRSQAGEIVVALQRTPQLARIPRVRAKLVLPLKVIQPGGQDPLPGEEAVPLNAIEAIATEPEHRIEKAFRREAPLVILQKVPDGAEGLTLQVEEATAEGLSHTLRLQIHSTRPGAEGKLASAIVLDRHPFTVAQVIVPPLTAQDANSGASEVANWSNRGIEGSVWEIAGSATKFEVLLPPQAVGEAMEKREGEGIKSKALADYRFSPPARFELKAGYFNQRYAEAPWNLRRILGYAGQRAPGAALTHSRFELLYGMQADLSYPYLRLSELAGRLGSHAGRQSPQLAWGAMATKAQTDAYFKKREDWAVNYHLLLSRLAVFEAYDERQPAGTRVHSDLTYTLRKTSDIRQDWNGTDPFHGGATWGVEFKNVLDALWKNPKSVSAELANPYFSALGGWGYQKAGFDEDRQKIISTTGMGRLHYYCLERIGRIGVFWNVAKHVIIYERSVSGTNQFVGEQSPHTGRPVLRKVREYIEIIQPDRRYPEFGAAPATRGFVLGCEFKTRIINVNSKWGADVRDDGYQIPLWREGEDPDLYPKPQVTLHLAGDPAAGGAPVGVGIDEVRKLCFYSSTREKTGADPDLWAAVKEIDYADLPFATAPGGKYLSDANPDGKLAEPPPSEPGQDRFTFGVVPQERLVNLVAERSTGQTVGTVIRNVSMSRSSATALNGQFQAIHAPLVAAAASIGAAFDQVIAAIPAQGQIKGTAEAWLRDHGKPQLQVLFARTGLAETFQGLNTVSGLDLAAINPCAQVRQAALAPLNLLESQLQRTVEQMRQAILAEIDSANNVAADARSRANQCVAVFEAQFHYLASTIETGLGSFRAELLGAQALLREQKTRVHALLTQATSALTQADLDKQRLLDRWEPIERDLEAKFAEVERALDGAAKGKFANLIKEVKKLASDLRSAIREKSAKVRSALREVDPVKIVAALLDLETVLLALLDAGIASIETAIQTIPGNVVDEKLGLELEAIHQKLTNAINATTDLTALRQTVNQKLDELQGSLKGSVALLRDKLDAQVTTLCEKLENNLAKRIDTAGEALDAFFRAKWEEVEKALAIADDGAQQVRAHLLELQREATQFADSVTSEIEREGRRLIPGDLAQAADNTLRLVRAFGDPPTLNDLVFNRDRVAYYFNELDQAVKTTPMAALVNRAGDQLKSFGLRVPTKELLDRCVPAGLEDFTLSKILPDFGGMRLDNLFPGVRLPALSNRNIKVTHGADAQSRRAWMDASVDVPMPGPSTIFSFGPLLLTLNSGQFHAKQRIDVQEGESPKSTTFGEVAGSWDLQIGGTPLVVFRDTKLRYDGDGGLKFDLSPDRVEVQGAMKFLGDVIRQVNTRGKGFVVRVKERGGVPIGVEARLNLPLPDLAFGAFSLMNLRLGAFFDLDVSQPRDFTIGIGFNIGTKITPFRLTVLFLTGGGWFQTSAKYFPSTGKLVASVTIGIVAGAALEFSFGPIRGGVMVVLGIYGEYETPGSGLSLSIMLLAQGQVDIAGIVSAFISVLLEMTYQGATGTLIGTGTVSVSIKISFFFTLNVSTSVQYVFAGSDKNLPPKNEAEEAVNDYLAMMEG